MRKRKTTPRSKVLFGIALLVATIGTAGAAVWLTARNETGPGEPARYPVPYSDTHITENAIVTDPRFKDIAATHRPGLVASVLLAFPLFTHPAPESMEPERGTWLWTPTPEITPVYRDSVIAGARASGIKNIYLSLDSYLDIYVMPDGPAKAAKQKAFDETVEGFIRAARAQGITVDAEGGWRNWAERRNTYKAFALLKYVKGFNATHAEKFRGFQYDVEPYLLAEYQTDKPEVLANYLDLIAETVAWLDGTDLWFSIAIPDFYDGAGETPRFFYGLRYGYALNHLLAILGGRPGSTLIVMAYHNQSGGPDGSIAAARGEVEAAGRRATSVVVAQETDDVSPPSLTFYRTSRARLNAALADIEGAFASDAGYNGTAIHYINSLLALK